MKIIAQMGSEPIIKALDYVLKGEAGDIITGKALNTTLFVAYPLKFSFSKNPAYHKAKVLECGALVAVPSSGVMDSLV